MLMTACGQQLPAWNAGTLVVIVPESTQGGKAEFERELAQLFAEQLHATLETHTMSQNQAIAELQQHHAHLAAISVRRENAIAELQFGPTIRMCGSWRYATTRNPLPKNLPI